MSSRASVPARPTSSLPHDRVGGRFIPGTENPLEAAEGSNLTTPEIRVQHVVALKPEICSLDVGTMNFGSYAVLNTPPHMERYGEG